MPEPRPIRVPGEHIDSVSVLRHAAARHNAMKRSTTAYKTTTLRMQDVGLLGEYAVALWLRQHHPQVIEIVDTPDSRQRSSGDLASVRQQTLPDGFIQTDTVTLEVKTSRYDSWKKFGRTLDFAQLRRSTAPAYIWCVVSNDWPTESVLLMGWLRTDAIRTPEVGNHLQLHNRTHWHVSSPMCAMDDLPAWWRDEVPFVAR